VSTSAASEVNREFYDQALPGRDDYWQKMAAPRVRTRQLLALLEALDPARVVDLGSGGGQLLAEIRARHPRALLSGIDVTAAQLADNARRMPTVDWHLADLDANASEGALHALRGTFDAVIASELIEHLDHPETFLRNARELARAKTGHLLLSTQSGPLRETERRVGHRRHWSRDEMVAALDRSGWTPLRVWNCGFPFHDLSKWYANLDPDGSMARFAEKPYGLREDLICHALRIAFRFNSRHVGAQLFALARRADP
jgi:2-polyprenyl-3-methyl-5-hydroxy-6-metoxy-1,4-benzoquinol methylase